MDANEITGPVREHWRELVELAGGYLEPNGWFTSPHLGHSVDSDGWISGGLRL